MKKRIIISPLHYARMVTRLLTEPGRFFSESTEKAEAGESFVFLFMASSLYTLGVYAVSGSSIPVKTLSAFFINTFGMCLVAMLVGHITLLTFFRKRQNFSKLIIIYASSFGVTSLVSWVPYFLWFTEPWKWSLIGIGLTRCCGLKWYQAVLAVLMTLLIISGVFLSLYSMI